MPKSGETPTPPQEEGEKYQGETWYQEEIKKQERAQERTLEIIEEQRKLREKNQEKKKKKP